MTLALIKIDSVPLQDDEFSFSYQSWVSVMVDTINEDLRLLESNLIAPSLTQAQIIALSATAQDGAIWYCSDHIPPVYVGKISGALVQFTTTPFP